jgi:hypothetical protein
MAFFNHFKKKNRTFSVTFFLILTLSTTMTLFMDKQMTHLHNERSLKGLDTPSPKASYVYYENTVGTAYDVFVSGNYAYVADGPSGLAVIDISDPTNPGTPVYEDSVNALSVYVSGNYAYVADDTGDLKVIDISNPTNPGTPEWGASSGNPRDVYVSGNYAYMADVHGCLSVSDISDPTDPSLRSYKNTNGDSYGVHVSGNYAFVADGPSGLAVIDITNPLSLGTPVYENTNGNANDVFVIGDYAYVADGSTGLAIIDISNPTNPGAPVYENTIGIAKDIYVDGNYAYVADDTGGLAVIDISLPTNPSTPVYEDTTGNVNGVCVSGNYAYVAAGSSGLVVIDIAESINPSTPVYENTADNARRICVSGDYAYVADDDGGLAVFDISNPTNPGLPVYENTFGYVTSVAVSGDYAYVTDKLSGLWSFDISNPADPVKLSFDGMGGIVSSDVYVSGDYAYVATNGFGLIVYDISAPHQPILINMVGTTGSPSGIDVSGDYAYIAVGSSGLAVIDISDPTTPGLIGYEDTTGDAYDVYVCGDYAYIADGGSGLAVIDISNPANPGLPVYENTVGDAYGIYVSGDFAYVADDFNGLAVIDISTPTNPGTPVYEATSGWARGVCVSGDYAYIADGSSGLAVIQVRQRVDMVNPVITSTPSDFTLEFGYTGQSIPWTATDPNPDTYTIDLQGTGTVKGSTAWASGAAVTYDIPDGFAVGLYVYTVTFTDDYGNSRADSVTVTVSDTTSPIITNTPSDLTVEFGYTGQSISWTTTDLDPNTYTVELLGTGIVASPTAWASGVAITYNIPDGFAVGDYVYTVTFTDDSSNDISESVTFTVEDSTNPTITDAPSDVFVELGYTDQSVSWTAVDPHPNTYTIELQGAGIVAGPTVWASGAAITFDIPEGFTLGVYDYTVTFTDDYSNVIAEGVTFTVRDTTNPTITNAPDDLTVEFGYTEQKISWTATDLHPNTYTIELQRSGIVVGPTDWASGAALTYNIPDGFALGVYIYTINFTDDYGNSITDSVAFAVGDTTNPNITSSPSDITMEFGYTGQSLSWTAMDAHPYNYTIELSGPVIVAGPAAWASGVAITYSIPDGLAVGIYDYTIIFTDDSGNFNSDTITFTVNDPTIPTITNAPSDRIVEFGYTGENISWTATDVDPTFYTIELLGSGIVAGPTMWTSGAAITYGIPDGLVVGVYVYTVNFTDSYGNDRTDSVTFTVDDTTDPNITDAPSDLIVEFGYTDQSISWTATDLNPDTYTIELQGSGIIAGPTIWFSGVAIVYNIPDDFAVGVYVYMVNFTDGYGNNITESYTFTVIADTTNPIIINAPNDLTVEFGYSGQSVSWTATDTNPTTFTIELQGSGIVAGPSSWTSDVEITLDIPDGLALGVYNYIIIFTDNYGYSMDDSFTFTVEDTTDPIITNAPSDLTVEFGYTGQSISWIATDPNPSTCTIELQGSGIVAGPTAWTSATAITYDIPDGLAVGVYVYTITFSDDGSNSITHSLTFTVDDTTNPTILSVPSDLIVEFGYTGQSISWIAMDSHPNIYTIELQGSGIVAGPTAWTSGAAITFTIPDGFAVDVYVFLVTFTDDYGNSNSDSVSFRVEDASTVDTTNPIITTSPSDFTVEVGYTGQSISWTATDVNPYTYTIELQGTGIVVESSPWTSGITITYNILNGNPVGVYVFTIIFTDDSGNSISDSVAFSVEDISNGDNGGGIPGARFELTLLISIGAVVSIIIVKKRKNRANLLYIGE